MAEITKAKSPLEYPHRTKFEIKLVIKKDSLVQI